MTDKLVEEVRRVICCGTNACQSKSDKCCADDFAAYANLVISLITAAERRRCAEEHGWRPIETAPKDGTEILILTERGISQARYAPGEWMDHYENGREYNGPVWVCCDDAWQVEIEETPDGDFHGEATHWMPLPSPPAAAIEAGE